MKCTVPVPWLLGTGETDGGVKLCVVQEADGSDAGRNTDHTDSFNQANAHKTRQNQMSC